MNRPEHLLACLAEECDEVGKNCMKALRFGLADGYPGSSVTNAQEIAKELSDLIAVMRMLVAEGLIPKPDLGGSAITAKQTKVEKYLAYAREVGALVAPACEAE
ncbi:hypothetical protein [Mesorhizobium sp. GbtcB19]|uniref:hypothetical protein n=1 Tax=Mesorhizobium sp. GbtcB19 TaxID=2824764 RepID=UPI001C2FD8EC|nr:hypothetical protein [Mesorhizobium sp. GbtcB19]